MSVTSLQDSSSASPPARSSVSRRFVLLAAPAVLAGCVSSGGRPVVRVTDPRRDPMYLSMYGPMPNERFPIPAVDLRLIDPVYYRQQVVYDTDRRVGTVIVDPQEKFLFLVQPDGMAMRYGIGVGREGFGWTGNATIKRKAAWPRWTPPAEMVARDPEAAEWAGGMPPRLDNPLGARALYLYEGGRDTLYRIHGSNEPASIGNNVSSGCIRLINQDIIDLYERVPLGSEVVVLGGGGYYASSSNRPTRRGTSSMTSLL
ncbi:MAG TPA: L,D-transpeptidase [Methylomirabilota bacterium]|nr:L,D-transpeptidase [Methylomirabilota bacterium]